MSKYQMQTCPIIILRMETTNQQVNQKFKDAAQLILDELGEKSEIQVEQLKIQNTKIIILRFNQIASTMNFSQKWPRDYLEQDTMLVFTCQSQTKGVGQGSNIWLSPPGNVYMTILAKLKIELISLLSIAVGVSTCRMVEESLNLKALLKWINDINIDNKKISGCLVRTQFGQFQNFMVAEIGIGVNVKQSPLESSSSLQKQCGRELRIKDIFLSEISSFVRTIKQFENSPRQQLRNIFKKYLMYLGENVYIYDSSLTNILHEGIFQDVNEEGYVILKVGEEQVLVASGRMRNEKV